MLNVKQRRRPWRDRLRRWSATCGTAASARSGSIRVSRGRYATDASAYQVMPLGVAVPGSVEEAARALAIARQASASRARRRHFPMRANRQLRARPRCSKHLDGFSRSTSIIAVRVEPGIVLDDLNRQLKPHGLWFPVDISTASRATIGGMAGNNSCGGRSLRYGPMRDNVAVHRRGAGGRDGAHFGRVAADLSDRRADDPRRRLFCGSAAPRRARSGEVARAFRRCSGASAAIISTRWPAAAAIDGRSISRISSSAPKARSPFSPRSRCKLWPVLGRRAVGVCHFGSFYEAMEPRNTSSR